MNSKVSTRISISKPSLLDSVPTHYLVIIIVLLAVFSCIPLLNADFIWYDDDIMVFKNPLIQLLSFDSIKKAFGFDNIVHYHPLVYISFAVEKSLFGLNPNYFHITNIILHCLNSILVLSLILALRVTKLQAFITALLFAVHPMHIESVSWITERKDLLYALFYFCSLLFYLKFYKNNNTNYYIYSLLFFILSCLSKSMAVTLPFILIAIDFYFSGTGKLKLKNKVPYLFISLVFIVLNLQTAFYKTDIHIYSIYERISFIFYAVLFYPVKMLLPYDLSAVYIYPLNPGFEYLISPIIFAIIAIILFKYMILSKNVKFGLSFYLITILPVLPVIPFGISLTADRFSYVPLLGLFFIISYLLNSLIIKNDRYSHRKYLLSSVTVGVILFLSILSFNRAGLWKNTESLMKDAIAKNTDNYFAYFILGNYYSDNNRLKDGIDSYNNCLRIKPDYGDAYFNLGNAYFVSGNYDNSVLSYLKAIELNPNDKMAYNNLGYLYESLGDKGKAIEYYRISAGLGYEPAMNVLKYYGINP